MHSSRNVYIFLAIAIQLIAISSAVPQSESFCFKSFRILLKLSECYE